MLARARMATEAAAQPLDNRLVRWGGEPWRLVK
jgi:hypothetical protein